MSDGRDSVRRCPHANIIHCPLYAGMHIPGGPGCFDGKEGDGMGCGVARGTRNYKTIAAAMAKKHPFVVVECALAENAAITRALREGNMRSNGIH